MGAVMDPQPVFITITHTLDEVMDVLRRLSLGRRPPPLALPLAPVAADVLISFSLSSLGFYLVLIGFYWVFTGFYWVLLGFTGFYWVVLLSFIGFYMGFTGF